MTNDPRKPHDDSKLEQELDELRAEWRGMAQAEPPDLVDQAVLNAARRELEAGRRRRPLRWLGGFATAAVVVVALTLVVEQDPRRADLPPAPESSRLQEDALQKQAEPAKEAAPMQAPLPAAEPRPMAREARRDPARLKAMEKNAAPEEAEPGRAQRFDSPAAAAAPLSDSVETPSVAEEALQQTILPDPEAWIEQLLELRAQGETEALEAGIDEFRSIYPEHPLPPELLEQFP